MHPDPFDQVHPEHHPLATAGGVPDRRALLAGIGGLAAGALFAGARTAHAGPLSPPPGPIASTGKTLTEVEPRIAINSTNLSPGAFSQFAITQPGSYYLTGNILGQSGLSCIEVAASGVTIDLMGFELRGVPGTVSAIRATIAGLTNVRVRNGSIRNWGAGGINFVSANVTSCAIEGVLASGNTGVGMNLGSATSVTNCTATQNSGAGISVASGCTVTACVATFNAIGFQIGSSSTIAHSAARNNTGNGITLGIGALAFACTSASNQAVGITSSSDCRILNCMCTANADEGIVVLSRSFVSGCETSFNGLSGIRIELSGSRVDSNNSANNATGIRAVAAGNFIARNTCTGNTTNWDIAANNKCLVLNGVNAGAITGNSGGTAPGVADPNANFTF